MAKREATGFAGMSLSEAYQFGYRTGKGRKAKRRESKGRERNAEQEAFAAMAQEDARLERYEYEED